MKQRDREEERACDLEETRTNVLGRSSATAAIGCGISSGSFLASP
jgi:hypothetical protein